MSSEPIFISDYDYPLPDERIAKYPLKERDTSKLLVYKSGQIREDKFFNVGEYLPKDTLLVYNNTRVIHARLVFYKESGARIEVFCLEPIEPSDYESSLSAKSGCIWKCMIGNLKKWKSGDLRLKVAFGIAISAELLSSEGNTHIVHFTWSCDGGSFAEILEKAGELPIPPYLNRKTEESDKTTYQTVYSRIDGSVAAPTAGLHFTNKVLDGLRQKGIKTTELTLHVGAGTFQPVKVEDVNDHQMHSEYIEVSYDTVKDIKNNLGHICAVGTTSMRTLESLYYLGVMLDHSMFGSKYELSFDKYILDSKGDFNVPQFAPYRYNHTMSAEQALQNVLDYLDDTEQIAITASTQILIRPGYKFRVVDSLITNFHQPKSTLLLLVSAFVNGDWHKIYDYALSHDFRFLSYGDSSLLFRE